VVGEDVIVGRGIVDSSEKINSYRELRVWQESMRVAETAYILTGEFPRGEAFGMTAQIRRAATSVPANIAEGYGRETRASFVHFLRISQGSLKELETLLLLAGRVSLGNSKQLAALLGSCDELGRMLRSLIRSLQGGLKK
jgi:four helix bundle protein